MKPKISSAVSRILQLSLILFSSLMLSYFLVEGLIVLKKWNGHFDVHKILLIVVLILISIAAIGMVCWLLSRIPDQRNYNVMVLLALLSFFAVVFTIWIYLTPTKQYSDYGNFWIFAQKALKGKAIYQIDNDYFAKWAYQTGFLTYVMAICKFFNSNIRVIQLFNVGAQLLILLLTYLLTQKLFHKTVLSRWSVFLLGINLEWFALNNRVTNQYLGLIFFLLSFIFIIDNRPYSWALAGVTLALGNYFRPLGIIFIASIIVYFFVYQVPSATQKWFSSFKKLISFIFAYCLCMLCLSGAIKYSGLNEYGLSNRDSEWKFVTGLNYSSTGTYSKEIEQKFNLKDSRAKMLAKEKAVTKQNVTYLTKHNLWLPLFVKKFWLLWSYPSNSLSYSLFGQKYGPQKFYLLVLTASAINLFEIILFFIASLACWRKKLPVETYLLLLTIFAYACAQELIEVQGRYRLEFTPIIVIIATLGLEVVFSYFSSKSKKGINN